ncbi:MAG TPA: DUF983 domain-containing protein [Candidatus Tectomicrobia bacterium]
MPDNPERWRVLRMLSRGLRLCCPRCGARTLFRGWFAMHARCAVCHFRFEREQGYFLGAMYVNYAFTVVIVLSGYFVLSRYTHLSLAQHLVLWSGVSILCPLLLFRHARGVWLSLDYLFNPVDNASPEANMEQGGEPTQC